MWNQNELQAHKGAFLQRSKATLCNTVKDKKICSRPGNQILGATRQSILRSSIPIPSPSADFQIISLFKTQPIWVYPILRFKIIVGSFIDTDAFPLTSFHIICKFKTLTIWIHFHYFAFQNNFKMIHRRLDLSWPRQVFDFQVADIFSYLLLCYTVPPLHAAGKHLYVLAAHFDFTYFFTL